MVVAGPTLGSRWTHAGVDLIRQAVWISSRSAAGLCAEQDFEDAVDPGAMGRFMGESPVRRRADDARVGMLLNRSGGVDGGGEYFFVDRMRKMQTESGNSKIFELCLTRLKISALSASPPGKNPSVGHSTHTVREVWSRPRLLMPETRGMRHRPRPASSKNKTLCPQV